MRTRSMDLISIIRAFRPSIFPLLSLAPFSKFRAMKKAFWIPILFSAVSLFAAEWASDYQSMSAFQKSNGRTGYVKPIATYMGTVLNGSWISTAHLERNLSIEFGLPFQIALIESGDRSYSTMGVEIPTIFGDKAELELGGNEDLHGLSVFTLPYLQVGVEFFYTRLALRGMIFPSVSELRGYHVLSFGLQHSFGHLFLDKLPAAFRDFDVSLFFGYNSAYIGYLPDDWSGKLDLDFGTTYTAIVFGYRPIQHVEFLLSLGYQTVSMDAGGELDAYTNEGVYQGKISPDVSVDGRGGFRLGLEVAFSFGSSYHPVVGYNLGANNSFNANVLYFRQTFAGSSKDSVNDHIVKEPEEKSEQR